MSSRKTYQDGITVGFRLIALCIVMIPVANLLAFFAYFMGKSPKSEVYWGLARQELPWLAIAIIIFLCARWLALFAVGSLGKEK